MSACDQAGGGVPLPNYLVISDLHLSGAGPDVQDGLRPVDRALIQFVDWHAAHPREGRPWRLIIAGDGIDFLHHSLLDPEGAGAHQEHTEQRAVAALEAIVRENRPVFAALVRFVAAGHELVLLQGNHDVELHWSGVQARLRQLLVQLFAEAQPGAEDAGAFEARVFIHRWFYYRHGLLYVEHGHQYDELCAFEDVLYPVDADARIAAPLSHVTLRRFRGLLHRLDAHNLDRWGLKDFLRWVLRLDRGSILRSGLTYASSPGWLARLDRRRRRGDVARAHQIRSHRLDEVLAHSRLELEVVQVLDRLKRSAAGRNLWLGLRMLFFDQLALFGLGAAAVVALSVLPVPPPTRLLVLLAVGLGTTLLSRRGLRTRAVDPRPKLAAGARAVAEVLRVPFIVFGHSHLPEVRPLDDAGATYINTGSWTHEGQAGLTYFQLVGEAGTLCRWGGPVPGLLPV